MKIDKIKKEDLGDVENLINFYYPNDNFEYLRTIIEETIDRKAADKTEVYFTIKNEAGKTLGIVGFRNCLKKFISFAKTENPLEIIAMFVEKDIVKKGIGYRMVEFAKEYATQNGYKELIARSASQFQASSWGFYEKIGFEKVGYLPEQSGKQSAIFSFILS